MMIPPTWSKLRFLIANMASVTLSDHDVIIALVIPLIMKSSDLTYWRVSAIPHLLSLNNLQETKLVSALKTATILGIPPGVAILDYTNER